MKRLLETVFVSKVFMIATTLFLLTSCYSINYVAKYDLNSSRKSLSQKEVAVQLINNLAEQYELSSDTKFEGNDTLAFYGKPYHYFKFIINEKDGETNSIVLDYHGAPTNRSYRNLLNDLKDSIEANYSVKNVEINETK